MWGSKSPPPTPPTSPSPTSLLQFGPSLTDESKLIASLQLAVTVMALYVAYSWRSTTPPNGENVAQAPSPLTTFSIVAAALGLVVGPPGSVDAFLQLLALSPLPPGAFPAICVLSAALIVAFRFTSIALSVTPEDTVPTMLPRSDSVLHLIQSRRSIFPKDYSGAVVPRHAILRALEAANWAPTHGKTEPWRFVIFYGEGPLARFHAAKRGATERQLASEPEKLAAALKKIDKKQKDLANLSAIVAIVLKRYHNTKGALMPMWEEEAAVACAVQNFHLQLCAEGYAGYWSSGGVDGWCDDLQVRSLVGADGECDGERDKVLGWFHVGATDKGAEYKARRRPVEAHATWIAEADMSSGTATAT